MREILDDVDRWLSQHLADPREGGGEVDRAEDHHPRAWTFGTRTPDETLVSICAEIIDMRSGRTTGRPLAATEGPIHQPRSAAVTAGSGVGT